MAFTGKSTYSAGGSLPELADDVSDVISIVSPYETPLLDHLGDAKQPARSTVHEWVEDSLHPNTDEVDQTVFTPNPTTATQVTVMDYTKFRVGDLVRPGTAREVMLVTNVSEPSITVVRGYGGTPGSALADGMVLNIIGNAAMEGAPADAARFTNRLRKVNYTQIFAATVDVSGSLRAAQAHGVADEVEYQKQERTRELLRDLENCVINGVSASVNPQGSTGNRRTMHGIVNFIESNVFVPGVGGIPGGGSGTDLIEDTINAALRRIWQEASSNIDTIVVGGTQKRRINSFISSDRAYDPGDTRYRNLVSFYESDFGVCRVVLSRWVPPDMVLLLDSSRISVVPLAGREFHYKELASVGDATAGQVIGEYTLEFRNESAHGVIDGLTV